MKYIWVLLLFSSCTAWRTLKWLTPNTNDYKKFTSIRINKSSKPFYFQLDSNIISNRRKNMYDSLLKGTLTNSFLIIHQQKIAYQYFADKNDTNNTHMLFSISKSFVSSLLSIAKSEGYIKSFDEPITNYLPQLLLQDTGFRNITIQMCLDMQTNLDFDETQLGLNSPIAKLYYGQNLNQTLSKIKLKNNLHHFEYQNANTQLILNLIESVTHQNFIDYFNNKIWQPMGAQNKAEWLVDNKKDNTPKSFCGLVANVYDVAKLGYLYANNGHLNGNQILDTGWINSCINFERNYTKNYTNHWWMNHKVFAVKSEVEAEKLKLTNEYKISKIGDYFNIFKTGNCLIAEGLLEQYLYVYPSKNLVIVRLGDNVPQKKTQLDRMIEAIAESF